MSPRVAVAEDRPTGRLHLGHLVGSLRNRVALQETHRCVFLVADLRALEDTPLDIRGFTREIVLDWLSVGLDPRRSTFALQSLVPEIGELWALLSRVAPSSRAFPLLTAADLLIFRADEVPVGPEGAADVGLVRELARRFNLTYGPVFAEPGAVLGGSLPATISLSDGPRDVERRVAAMTDEERAGYQEAFHADRDGLAGAVNRTLDPIRERRARLSGADPEELLREGSRQAREIAVPALEEVRVRARLLPATGRSRTASAYHAARGASRFDQPGQR